MDSAKKLPTVLSFCSGYGGAERGLDLAGFKHRVIAYVEIEAYAIANLANKMEAGELLPAPIWSNLKTLPVQPFRDKVDLITGGYPCQPFSAAGQRKGTDDPRHLWPYIRGHIESIRPVQCFFENVEGHITLGLREVISDLEALGYKTTWGIFSAREVGAPHQRKRVYILGNSEHYGSFRSEKRWGDEKNDSERRAKEQGSTWQFEGASKSPNGYGGERSEGRSEQLHDRRTQPSSNTITTELADSNGVRCDRGQLPDRVSERSMEIEAQQRPEQSVVRSEIKGCSGDSGEDVADPIDKGLQRVERLRIDLNKDSRREKGANGSAAKCGNGSQQIGEWEPEPGVGRVVDGCADRVDRIRALGNGIVPQTAAKAWITLNKRIEALND